MGNKKKQKKAKPLIRHYSSSEVQMLQSCSLSFGSGDAEYSISARTGEELLAILQYTEKYAAIRKLLNE